MRFSRWLAFWMLLVVVALAGVGTYQGGDIEGGWTLAACASWLSGWLTSKDVAS